MRIIVCDDEKVICDAMCQMLSEFFAEEQCEDVEIVGYQTGEAVLEDEGEKDIVFLDVILGSTDGITVGKELKARNDKTIIILVTAYQQYNDDAFRMGAFRFFVKPFDKERLFHNLREAIQLHHTANGKICVTEKGVVQSAYKSDVIFVESDGRGSIVHITNGVIFSSDNIEQWCEKLDQGCFVKTHKSYIVNMNYISSFDKETIQFENCKERAYLTKRKFKEFRNKYKIFLNGN